VFVLSALACTAPTPTPTGSTAETAETGDTSSIGTATGATGATGDTATGPTPYCLTVPYEPEPAVAGPTSVAESLANWEALKAAGSGDYVYSDWWPGLYTPEYATVITVVDDVVVERCLISSYPEPAPYVETGSDIGGESWGAEPLTVEQLHARCAAEIEPMDPALYSYVDIDYRADGVLRNCVYFPLDCYDDCEFGYRISTLTWL
jgi:hypothetical protein